MIEPELINPHELDSLIDEKLSQKGCPVCAINGHINWEIMKKVAMNQQFNCEECKDALAIICFAKDMVNVLKLNRIPEFPNNFQHWIKELSNLKLSDTTKHEENLISVQAIRELNNEEQKEFAFCTNNPEKIYEGNRTGVSIPHTCKNTTIVHNHPSGILELSAADKKVACNTNSTVCVVGKDETRCYDCKGELVDDIVSGVLN